MSEPKIWVISEKHLRHSRSEAKRLDGMEDKHVLLVEHSAYAKIANNFVSKTEYDAIEAQLERANDYVKACASHKESKRLVDELAAAREEIARLTGELVIKEHDPLLKALAQIDGAEHAKVLELQAEVERGLFSHSATLKKYCDASDERDAYREMCESLCEAISEAVHDDEITLREANDHLFGALKRYAAFKKERE